MTATSTQNEEDELLIISDDDSGESNELDLKMEEPASIDEEIINFGEDSDVDIIEEKAQEETIITESNGDLDLNFDLGDDTSEMTVEKMLGEKKADNHVELNSDISEVTDSKEDIFSFDLDDSEKDEVIETTENTGEESMGEMLSLDDDTLEGKKTEDNIEELIGFDVEESAVTEIEDDSAGSGDDGTTGDDDVNAILDATIARLVKRKENINAVKEKTVENIADLNKEIKGLQAEVRNHKTEVKEFDKETAKIVENVTELEKMKMG